MAYLGESIKKLGFGLMRLPFIGSEVDMEQTKQMIDLFMSRGFTYFDTAYGYNDGKSEKAIGELLVKRYPRDSFTLATKLPAWEAGSAEAARNMFWTSLERTGAGYFDFYLHHNVNHERAVYIDKYDLWNFVNEQKNAGLIKYVGMSFHDKADVLDQMLTEHPELDFVQLQLNYADWESEYLQARRNYEVARKHGKPITVMEPIKGGSLTLLPPQVADIFHKVNPDESLASWALRFVASHEGIITVLSGMSTLEQVDENTRFMQDWKPLNDEEMEAVNKVMKALDEIEQIPCTKCCYCTKGCPMGVNIPEIFKAYNNYLVFNNMRGAIANYGWATRDGGFASKCIECGQCESVCPQQIPIIENLKKARKLLEN